MRLGCVHPVAALFPAVAPFPAAAPCGLPCSPRRLQCGDLLPLPLKPHHLRNTRSLALHLQLLKRRRCVARYRRRPIQSASRGPLQSASIGPIYRVSRGGPLQSAGRGPLQSDSRGGPLQSAGRACVARWRRAAICGGGWRVCSPDGWLERTAMFPNSCWLERTAMLGTSCWHAISTGRRSQSISSSRRSSRRSSRCSGRRSTGRWRGNDWRRSSRRGDNSGGGRGMATRSFSGQHRKQFGGDVRKRACLHARWQSPRHLLLALLLSLLLSRLLALLLALLMALPQFGVLSAVSGVCSRLRRLRSMRPPLGVLRRWLQVPWDLLCP